MNAANVHLFFLYKLAEHVLDQIVTTVRICVNLIVMLSRF